VTGPPSSAPGAPSVRWLDSGQRPEAAAIWRALEAELGAHLSCSWDWTETWLEHFGGAVEHHFAVIELAGRRRGIVLVTRSRCVRYGVPLRVLHLGTAGEPEGDGIYVQYNALLIDPAVRRPGAAALIAALRRLRWHELHLDGFVPADAEVLLAARRGGDPDRLVCRTVALRGGLDGIVGEFSPSVRKVLRRGLRRIGEIEVAAAGTPEQAADVLDELRRLSDARWEADGRTGAFRSASFVAFHRTLAARLVPHGRVLLVRVRDADGTVGCGYVLVDGTKALAYQVGRRLEEDNRVSTGQLVELLVMGACADRGLAVYSHQSGDSEHKRRLSSGAEELVWARWRRGRALGLHRARELARRAGR